MTIGNFITAIPSLISHFIPSLLSNESYESLDNNSLIFHQASVQFPCIESLPL